MRKQDLSMEELNKRKTRKLHRVWFKYTIGFTLMELLVTITIIVILAAMLLPTLQQAREEAKQARWLGIKHSIRLDSYCVAYYTFEKETIKDNKLENVSPAASKIYNKRKYNPHDLDGTFGDGSTGVTFPTFVIDGGRFGKGALYFDGSNDYVSISDGRHVDLTEDLTVEFWIKYTYTANAKVIFKGTDPNDFVWNFNTPTSTRLDFVVIDAAGTTHTLSSGSAISDNKWHHVVGTLDAGNFMRKYYDGVLVDDSPSNGVPDSIKTNDHDITIGIDNAFAWYLKGLIDEIAIYSRALTEEEIKAHYRGGRP